MKEYTCLFEDERRKVKMKEVSLLKLCSSDVIALPSSDVTDNVTRTD
jgi:hypothetical protein